MGVVLTHTHGHHWRCALRKPRKGLGTAILKLSILAVVIFDGFLFKLRFHLFLYNHVHGDCFIVFATMPSKLDEGYELLVRAY